MGIPHGEVGARLYPAHRRDHCCSQERRRSGDLGWVCRHNAIPRPARNSSYLNELYRSRAEKAGIVYVDIWDGFVDEAGRYSPQGPDYEGQIRRLRSSDGVYFTKFGARKLAHYVDREIQRTANRGMPVALPLPGDSAPQAPNAKPGGPAQRPAAGPVVPLTAMQAAPEDLIGGGRAGGSAGDATASRVVGKGEAAAAPSGRADDFSWPRGTRKAPPPDSDAAALAAPEPTPDDSAAKPAQPPSGPRTSTADSDRGERRLRAEAGQAPAAPPQS